MMSVNSGGLSVMPERNAIQDRKEQILSRTDRNYISYFKCLAVKTGSRIFVLLSDFIIIIILAGFYYFENQSMGKD